jgi:predicted nucleic acid-binding protein
MTEIEILSDWKLTAEEEKELKSFLKGFRRITLTRTIKAGTIRFRQKCRRKLPDSIIAATAVLSRATLISNDSHLLQTRYPALLIESFELLPVSS